jgi:hypothetical protein
VLYFFAAFSEPLSLQSEITGRTVFVRCVPRSLRPSKRLWKLFHLKRSKPDLKPFIRNLRRKKTEVSVSSAEVLSFDQPVAADLNQTELTLAILNIDFSWNKNQQN